MTIVKAMLFGFAAAVAVVASTPDKLEGGAFTEFFLAAVVGISVAATLAF